MPRFTDRSQAGRLLADRLRALAGRSDVVVLALPRGGVPVGYEVALALDAPLDVFVVRKIGAPFNEELAVGAMASGGICLLDEATISALGIPRPLIEKAIAAETEELARREQLFRGNRPLPELRGRTVILVDDGLATGATMSAAVAAVREMGPGRIIVAVPIASAEACEALRQSADACACVVVPERLYGVGAWYDDFTQTTDAEVLELLAAARHHRAHAGDPVAANEGGAP